MNPTKKWMKGTGKTGSQGITGIKEHGDVNGEGWEFLQPK